MTAEGTAGEPVPYFHVAYRTVCPISGVRTHVISYSEPSGQIRLRTSIRKSLPALCSEVAAFTPDLFTNPAAMHAVDHTRKI
jgi:hypothetical protein